MYKDYLIVYCLAAFIVGEEKRLLIVKKSEKERIAPGMWVVPGGKVKADEHIIDALKREVKEEVGVSVIDYRWIGEDVFKISDDYFHSAHFFCKVKSEKKIKLEKNLLEYKWIRKNEVKNFHIPKKIKEEILNVFESYI